MCSSLADAGVREGEVGDGDVTVPALELKPRQELLRQRAVLAHASVET